MENIRDIIRKEVYKIFESEIENSSIKEKWTNKYKKSINCSNPKGFSQKAHCAARKKRQRGEKTNSKSPFS